MQNGKKVILYIDDEQDFRDAVRVILEANGYVMVEAHRGDRSARVPGVPPRPGDCRLMMEEVDSGTSFVRDLQALGNTAPIYMLSSIATGEHECRLRVAGLCGFSRSHRPATLLSILRTRLN